VDDERHTAADVDRELRRLERVRRRERAARRRALRARLLPLIAAAVAIAAAAVGVVLVTGATHPRRTVARPAAHPTTKPRTTRPAAPPARSPRPVTLPARPTVTLIGDSVADEIAYLASARALVARGVRLKLDVAPCRRLAAESCTVAGYRPQTALELVRSRGRALGQVAVVAVGYNDYENSFVRDAKQVLAALHRTGVQQVLWLTLRANHHPYLTMNDALRTLATTTPWLTVVDWNRYSRSHPDWFKDDGLHLTPAGATAMARLLHRQLAALPRAASSSS
jgi:hypothetical protein